MAIKRIGAAEDIISLEEARTHLRITPYGSPLAHPDDTYITGLITAAREWTEEYLQRPIGTQTLELALDAFPIEIELKADVQSVTSIKYIDSDITEQTIGNTNYSLDNYSVPAWILQAVDYTWPTTASVGNGVKVRFVAGYTDGLAENTNPCPKSIISAMLLIIGNLYENRQENTKLATVSLPMGVYSLLQPYRLGLGV